MSNIENYVDDLRWGSLGDEAEIKETIVIVNREYTEFHFITITTNLCNDKKKIIIRNFYVKENEIQSTIFKGNQLSIRDCKNEEGLKRLLKLVSK